MTSSSHPKKKQAHLQKPRGVRWGLGKRRRRQGRSLRSLFPLRQCGKAGRPARLACDSAPSVHGASGRASREQCSVGEDSEAPGGAGSSGDILQLRGVAENEHCAGSQETELPTPPRLLSFLGLWRSPHFRPRFTLLFTAGVRGLGCSLWLARVFRLSPYEQKSPGRGPACLPAPGAPACSSSIPEYQ